MHVLAYIHITVIRVLNLLSFTSKYFSVTANLWHVFFFVCIYYLLIVILRTAKCKIMTCLWVGESAMNTRWTVAITLLRTILSARRGGRSTSARIWWSSASVNSPSARSTASDSWNRRSGYVNLFISWTLADATKECYSIQDSLKATLDSVFHHYLLASRTNCY